MSEWFDVGGSGIEPGITLIEASAGTGKTFAIAGMVVRLIAEKGCPLPEILVVTFTEAATQELRDRVRSRIREAITLLEIGNPEEDPALANLVDVEPEACAAAIRHLRNALLSFDEAAIFTIHGFCQRMLRENAFETGALFDVELLTDAEPILRETVEDFWRNRFYEAEPEIAALVVALQMQGRISPDLFVDLLRKVVRHPELKILIEEEAFSLEECQRRLVEVVGRLRDEWRDSRSDIAELLMNTKALSTNRRTGYPVELREMILAELKILETGETLSPDVVKYLPMLSARQLEESTVYGRPAPEHDFFEDCAEFAELVEAFGRLVRIDFIESIHRGALAESKRRRNVVTFDDLLTRLYDVLKGDGGKALARAIGGRFTAALIDEFQDTDPVQWEIFYRIFGSGRHVLFLIGDPKQAIYGFRGADIFTYMAARSKASPHYTLGTNWRSDERLVEGANHLFSQHDEVFVFPEIPFSPVSAAEAKEGVAFDLGSSGLSSKPLQVACVTAEDGRPLTVGPAKEKITGMMLAEIHRLLTSGVRRGGRLLEPGDMAVLVRSNNEAESVREQLVRAGVPAVVRTDRSVLQTAEAEHVLRLLVAILEPHKNGLIKAVLASPLFGYTATRINELDGKESAWEALSAKFYEWREFWHRHGFMRMFRAFLEEESVRVRLLALPDGERMVTNYQHLAECLHAVEYERILTPGTLVRWLREQSERVDGSGEDHLIRLEKDEEAVQIVTIHRSKGLEYPVVFCPFNWTSILGKPGTRELVFHDATNENRLTWDLRADPDPASQAAWEREQLAEAIRLLYVAVTRAQHRCYLFWAVTRGSVNPADCALAHAFGCGRKHGPEDPFVAFQALVEDGHADLHEAFLSEAGVAAYGGGNGANDGVTARVFDGELPQGPLITSFSGLTAHAHDEAPDHDALPETDAEVLVAPPIVEKEAGPSVFTFPKGAKAGNFFHTVLEKVDFSDTSNLSGIVDAQLKFHRFDAAYGPVISNTLARWIELPLQGGFSLADIGWKDRLVETPFYFPIRAVTPQRLAKVFDRKELPPDLSRSLSRLRFYPVDGYMTGFIDLVARYDGKFYVIDWKSNWLGPDAADYRGEALRGAMARNYYYLQYHLYTLALHRHLEQTLPGYDYERHFGGVFYFFLRGIDPAEPSSGVFHDRPTQALVETMARRLMGDEGV